jgi:hypothetical protein
MAQGHGFPLMTDSTQSPGTNPHRIRTLPDHGTLAPSSAKTSEHGMCAVSLLSTQSSRTVASSASQDKVDSASSAGTSGLGHIPFEHVLGRKMEESETFAAHGAAVHSLQPCSWNCSASLAEASHAESRCHLQERGTTGDVAVSTEGDCDTWPWPAPVNSYVLGIEDAKARDFPAPAAGEALKTECRADLPTPRDPQLHQSHHDADMSCNTDNLLSSGSSVSPEPSTEEPPRSGVHASVEVRQGFDVSAAVPGGARSNAQKPVSAESYEAATLCGSGSGSVQESSCPDRPVREGGVAAGSAAAPCFGTPLSLMNSASEVVGAVVEAPRLGDCIHRGSLEPSCLEDSAANIRAAVERPRLGTCDGGNLLGASLWAKRSAADVSAVDMRVLPSSNLACSSGGFEAASQREPSVATRLTGMGHAELEDGAGRKRSVTEDVTEECSAAQACRGGEEQGQQEVSTAVGCCEEPLKEREGSDAPGQTCGLQVVVTRGAVTPSSGEEVQRGQAVVQACRGRKLQEATTAVECNVGSSTQEHSAASSCIGVELATARSIGVGLTCADKPTARRASAPAYSRAGQPSVRGDERAERNVEECSGADHSDLPGRSTLQRPVVSQVGAAKDIAVSAQKQHRACCSVPAVIVSSSLEEIQACLRRHGLSPLQVCGYRCPL